MKSSAQRVDLALVERGLCESRELAKRLIMAGEVFVGTQRIEKASQKVRADDPLEVRERPPFVSRAGQKLAGALDHFGLDPAGRVCVDVGSSTGGFTDCLLQRGAQRVHAVDVGTNQLAWKLREDPRVVVREQFHARDLTPEVLGEKVSLAVADLSFISLTRVLEAVAGVLEEGGEMVVLIKPQFELSREEVGKGGIVREEEGRQKAVAKIREFASQRGWTWRGVVDSSLAGTNGNREFVAWMVP